MMGPFPSTMTPYKRPNGSNTARKTRHGLLSLTWKMITPSIVVAAAVASSTMILLQQRVSSFIIDKKYPRRSSFASTQSSILLNLASSSSSSSSLTNDEIARYSRHLVLSDVGMEGQKSLKDSSVLVVGAGGLGSPCLLYLAAAGVGHIGIVDGDVVDSSNLQRQIIHGTSTVGVTKCESAKRRINDINPFVQVRLYEEEFTSETAMRILEGGFDEETGRKYDVVVDGSDNFPTKYLINDACDLVGVPWVYSAILAFEGQMSVFNYQNGPTYRDLLPTPPPPGDVPSCAEGGVLGVLPGTMGCLQATETIKLLLGRSPDEISSGRVLVFDAMKMKFSEVGLAKQLGRDAITELIDYQGFCAGPKVAPKNEAKTAVQSQSRSGDKTAGTVKSGRTMDEVENSTGGTVDRFHTIQPQECLQRLSSGWTPFVLDVRLQTENDIVALPFTDAVVPHRTVRIQNIPEQGTVARSYV